MVSIHRVPVIVHLIIRVISSTFRFKNGEVFNTSPFFYIIGLDLLLYLDIFQEDRS